MEAFNPYLSIIVACRNDSHRTDMKTLLHKVIQQWSSLCQKYHLAAEYLVVEWNPPTENPSIKEILLDAPVNEYFKIRIITVSEKIHNKIDPQNILPLHQMIAKNTGIRRAKGKFLLCTNMDVFPDSLLIKEIANKKLRPGYYYRANRCDIPDKIFSVPEPDNEIFARQHIIRRMGMNSRWPGLKVYKKQYVVYRYEVFKPFYPILLIIKRLLLGKDKFKIATIDKEACGDFTLMNKEDWIKVSGYIEHPVYPLHIDTLALVRARFLGIKQHIFSKEHCVYHIDHKGSWTEETAHTLQIEQPYMSWSDAEKVIDEMKQGIFNYNTPNWGLEYEQLPETWIA